MVCGAGFFQLKFPLLFCILNILRVCLNPVFAFVGSHFCQCWMRGNGFYPDDLDVPYSNPCFYTNKSILLHNFVEINGCLKDLRFAEFHS